MAHARLVPPAAFEKNDGHLRLAVSAQPDALRRSPGRAVASVVQVAPMGETRGAQIAQLVLLEGHPGWMVASSVGSV